jgi:hypothetical protein
LKAIELSVSVSILNDDVFPLGISEFLQSLTERVDTRGDNVRWSRVQKSDPGNFWGFECVSDNTTKEDRSA